MQQPSVPLSSLALVLISETLTVIMSQWPKEGRKNGGYLRGVDFAEVQALKGSLSLVQVEERTLKLQAEVSRLGGYCAATCRFLAVCHLKLILHPDVVSNRGCRWAIDNLVNSR